MSDYRADLIGGPGWLEVSGTLRSTLTVLDLTSLPNPLPSDASLSYAVYAGDVLGTPVISGTAAKIDANTMGTAISIATPLDPTVEYAEAFTGTIGSSTISVIREARASRWAAGRRIPLITQGAIAARLGPVALTAPSAFGSSWDFVLRAAHGEVMARAFAGGARGEVWGDAALAQVEALLACALIAEQYGAGWEARAAALRLEYAAAWERLAQQVDINNDGRMDTAAGIPGAAGSPTLPGGR